MHLHITDPREGHSLARFDDGIIHLLLLRGSIVFSLFKMWLL